MSILENSNATRIAALWRGYSTRKIIRYTKYQCSDWNGYDAMIRVLEEEIERRPDLRRHIELFRAVLRKEADRLDDENLFDCHGCQCDWCVDYPDNQEQYDDRLDDYYDDRLDDQGDDQGDWWVNDGGGYCDY